MIENKKECDENTFCNNDDIVLCRVIQIQKTCKSKLQIKVGFYK